MIHPRPLPDRRRRRDRGAAAALVIATSIGGDVIVDTLVGALTIPVALIVLAGQIGSRAAATSPAADPE